TEPAPPHNGWRPRSRPVPPASLRSAPEQLQKARFAPGSSAATESNASQTGSVLAHALSCLPESPPAPAAPTPPVRHGGFAPTSCPVALSDTGRTLDQLRRTLPNHSQALPESHVPPRPPPARTHYPRRLDKSGYGRPRTGPGYETGEDAPRNNVDTPLPSPA